MLFFVSKKKYENLKKNYEVINKQRQDISTEWRKCQRELINLQRKLEKYERTRIVKCIKCGKTFKIPVNSRKKICNSCSKKKYKNNRMKGEI